MIESIVAPDERHADISRSAAIAVIALGSLLAACDNFAGGDANHKINGGVHVVAGTPATSAATVNGGIDVDDHAAVTSAAAVNGGIKLGADATAESLQVVNGGVELSSRARVTHAIKAVNGGIKLRDGAEVGGAVENVNGTIELHSAHVGGAVRTATGDILVMGDSHVDGGLVVRKSSSAVTITDGRVPRVVIGPGSTVSGEMRFERPVQLYVSDRATVGNVLGATAVTFAGETPP